MAACRRCLPSMSLFSRTWREERDMSAKTMLAIAVRDGAGPPSALHAVQSPVPTARAGEILIRVRAAGVNRPDLLQRMGNYPPPPGAPDTLGLEAVSYTHLTLPTSDLV